LLCAALMTRACAREKMEGVSKIARKGAQKSSSGKAPRPQESSMPDVAVHYTPVGRETLSAIASEVTEEDAPAGRDDSSPVLEVGEAVMGRETHAAIERELHATRGPLTTLRYGDRLANAPGAKTPSSSPGPRKQLPSQGPEIIVTQGPIGRETQAAIEHELGIGVSAGTDGSPDAVSGLDACDVYEMVTFVIKSGDISGLTGADGRRAFVESRLLHRLPVAGMADVDRIDVTPWTVRGSVIVRVWCRVQNPSHGRA
jgi:hypothetical protein